MRGLIIVLAILYIISPIDLVPDVVPVAGWLDDLGALGAVIATVLSGLGQKKLGK